MNLHEKAFPRDFKMLFFFLKLRNFRDNKANIPFLLASKAESIIESSATMKTFKQTARETRGYKQHHDNN